MLQQINQKRILMLISIIVLVALGLSACNSAAPTIENAPTVTQESEATQVIEPSATPTVELTPTATATSEPTVTSEPPTPTVEPTQSNYRTSEIDGMDQIYIPAGEFKMGTNDPTAKQSISGGVAYPEGPEHTVYLDGYWIDKYEVTTSQYAKCVAAGVCKTPWHIYSFDHEHYYDNPAYANYPVIYVDWWMASTYCAWAGGRLPTEAEWEKAARGTDGRMYAWGNDPVANDKANFCDHDCPRPHANQQFDDGYRDLAPVGSYPAGASAYGLLDMAGNVWEWTSSVVKPYPYVATDGREDPNAYAQRIWRGGTLTNGVWWLRVTVRYRSVQKYRFYNLGMRCASSK